MQGFALRTMIAFALIAAAAVASAIIDSPAQHALVVLVVGTAAVLVAAGTGDATIEPAAPATEGEQLAEAELLDAIVEPVMLVRDGRVALANRAARALLGAHIVGEDIRVAIRHPAAAERLAVPRIDADTPPVHLVGVGPRDQRWEMRVADTGSGARVIHLIDQTGSYTAEKMRVDFVANASHELRTPLASVLGYVETLRDAAGDDPQIRDRFLGIIDDEARRMERLVEDLISLSRIEADKYRVPATAIDLSDLVAEVRAELADAHGDRGADIVAVIDAAAPDVLADRTQLSQMLHNLVGNAMKYGRAGTPVTIAITRDSVRMVRLSVSDEGEGIAPEHLPRLTERFYRVDSGRSRSLGGTGLGLAIVKHIVERHRGRLDIASQVGVGTRVSVTLPVAEPAAPPLSGPPSGPPSGSPSGPSSPAVIKA